MSEEPHGSNCANGGTKIDVGIDVDSTEYWIQKK